MKQSHQKQQLPFNQSDNKEVITRKQVDKTRSFWSYNFTETDTLSSTELNKKKTLSFSNTIGYSQTNPIIMHKRMGSGDNHPHPIQLHRIVFIPKCNGITGKTSNSTTNKDDSKVKQTKLPSVNVSTIQMKPTSTFLNLPNTSTALKYKIKKEDIPHLVKPIVPQQGKGMIININHNINHNIQINVNNTSGKLALNPINYFKNIKIKGQNKSDTTKSNANADITFNNNSEGNSNVNPNPNPNVNQSTNSKCISMTIVSDESIPLSLQNSFITKKSNDDLIKNTKISNTLLSNISAFKEQDTLLSYNYSEDDFGELQQVQKQSIINDGDDGVGSGSGSGVDGSLNNTINKKKLSTTIKIDKEAFKKFCIEMERKLALIK